jgi:hypothetical protein
LVSLRAATILPDARGASFQLATTAFEQAFTAQRPECPLESGHALAHDSVAAWKAAPRAIHSGSTRASERGSQMSLEKKYANYLQVGHNALEIVLEFGQLHKDNPEPLIHSAIITSPAYAKHFLQVLAESITQYEHDFGEIAEP